MSKVLDHSLPKPCKTCGRVLPPEAYRLALAKKSLPTARKTECKDCADQRLRYWRAANPQRVETYRSRYAETDRARHRAYSKRDTESLTDRYVAKVLGMPDAPAPLIDAKRAHIKVQRLLKDLTK